jgi:hypothetical protein
MLSSTTYSFAGPEQDVRAALEQLEQANKRVNNDPEAHLDALASAIARVEEFPEQLADDAQASELLDLATLNLVRALLRADRRAEAAERMDELLRRSVQTELPVQRFGPTLVDFHDARVDALRKLGTAQLEITCAVECEVLLDRHEVGPRPGVLYLGTYELAITASDRSLPTERHTITLDTPGERIELAYPMAGSREAPPAPQLVTGSYRRVAPRWAEVLLMIVGAGAVGASGALLALDGRCTDGAPPVDANGIICPRLYEATAAGAIALGLGATALTSGMVLLSVDEVRSKAGQRGSQAVLSVRLRF